MTRDAQAAQELARPSEKLPPLLRASVIIVNHNGGDELRRCLASVVSAAPAGSEVIVVDNASTDLSAEAVERDFPPVRLIRSRTNLGFGGGNNLGANLAQGNYLAFLNPDTTVEAGWLETLVRVLECVPRAGLVTPKILQMDAPERISACGNNMHFTGLTLGRGMGSSREEYGQVERVTAVSGAAFCVRSDVFRTLGGFDAAFFMYMEDADLSLRTRLAGYECLYVPTSVVFHDYSLRIGPSKTFYQERNRYVMLLKNLRWRTLFVLSPALVLAELVTWGFAVMHDRAHFRNKGRAYVWVTTHWNEIMQSRRAVQAMRRVRDRELIGACGVRLAYEQTGGGMVIWLAHVVFDTLFFMLHKVAMLLIWW